MERRTLVSIVFLAACIYLAAAYTFPQMKGSLSGWYDPVVTTGEINAAEWAYDNLPHQSHFAGDMFACEMLTAVAFQICSMGGAWELADNPNQRYSDNERTYLTDSATEAHGLLAKYNITYVFASSRQGFYAYGWKDAKNEKFDTPALFEKIYDADGAKIYKVK
ncbi:MAG: hypothetical protein WCX64_02355 [Candidatus Micrarchaeia archaeon]